MADVHGETGTVLARGWHYLVAYNDRGTIVERRLRYCHRKGANFTFWHVHNFVDIHECAIIDMEQLG